MDEDFDTASFDEAYDISDFGDDQAFSTADMAPVTTTFGGGNFVDIGLGDDDDSLSSILNPALGGGNRTNITNVGGGSNLVYDPAFAAALDISRGLDPTNNLGGTGGLTVPSYLRPQIEGEFYDPFGDKPMFFSQGEKFLQETLPEIVRSGPIARLARGIGSVFQEGIDFAKDATAGIKLPSLKDISEGFTNFVDGFRPQRTVTRPDERAVMGSLNPTDRFLSDMRQVPMSTSSITGNKMMNTGIASVRPQQMQDVDRNVVEALQLIPSNLETNPTAPIAKVSRSLPASDIFNLLPTKEDREKRDFARDIFAAFPDQRTRQFGPKDRLASINEEYFDRLKNQQPFVDTGNFIVLD